MENLVGKKLGGYKLLRLLGSGGFGEVYLGEHRHDKQLVAVKVLQPLAGDDFSTFINEARAFRLIHPNIAQVVDFGIEKKVPFIVMKYAPNGTLRQRHPRGTRLPLSLVVSYVLQAANALQYAHHNRTVHRDIKPENLLVGSANEILVSDFGIATIIQSSRSYNIQEAAGTVTYMAPEQIQGMLSAASDQYALGIMVYEWLCGYPPFSGTFVEIATQHMLTIPTPLTSKIPELSHQVESVVLKALEKNPNNRFNNIHEFAKALEKSFTAPIGATIFTHRVHRVSGESNSGVIWSPDDKFIAFDQDNYKSYAIHVLDVFSNKSIKTYELDQKLDSMAWLNDGLYSIYSKHGGDRSFYWAKSVTGDEYSRIYFQNMASGTSKVIPCHRYYHIVDFLKGSPNGKYIAVVAVDYFSTLPSEDDRDPFGHTVEVYDTDTCSFVLEYTCESTHEYYDKEKGANISEIYGNRVTALSWSPDSTKLVSLDNSHIIRIWDVNEKREIMRYHQNNGVSGIAWSPDGTWIATDDHLQYEWMIRLRNLFTDKVVICKGLLWGEGIDIIRWSPNGKYIAVASRHYSVVHQMDEGDNIYIFDTMTGQCIFVYDKPPGYINDLCWSHNSLYIASIYEHQVDYSNTKNQLVVNVWVAPQ